MSSIPNHQDKIPTQAENAWRVLLIGRTGLDQKLRRDPTIELIRARDTFDAIGELSDPIDDQSPANPVVIIAPSSEPDDHELGAFINGLRLIDSSVRILRVGTSRDGYDGQIFPGADRAQILQSIRNATPSSVTQPFVFVGDSTESEECDESGQVESIEEQAPIEQVAPADSNESEPDSEPMKGSDEPRVVVIAKNEEFEHPAQQNFEDEPEIHQQVILHEQAPKSQEPKPVRVSERPVSETPIDRSQVELEVEFSQRMTQAMAQGRSVLPIAIELINARLNRTDISFVQTPDAQNEIGIDVQLNDLLMGKLVCEDQSWVISSGHESLVNQSRWLSSWIKLEVQQRELRKAAFTDSLTGAWNRRYFERYLDAAIVQSRTVRQPLTVMVFDIDGFKHYNDTYGHGAGDEILIETVRLLKSVIRPSDRVCRVGGDEFAVIFYEPKGPRSDESKPLESVYQIATRFQQQICTHRFPKLGIEAMGTLTVSGGLASYPWDGHNAETLLDQADQLAIESKRNGKNAMTLGPGAESVCKVNLDDS